MRSTRSIVSVILVMTTAGALGLTPVIPAHAATGVFTAVKILPGVGSLTVTNPADLSCHDLPNPSPAFGPSWTMVNLTNADAHVFTDPGCAGDLVTQVLAGNTGTADWTATSVEFHPVPLCIPPFC